MVKKLTSAMSNLDASKLGRIAREAGSSHHPKCGDDIDRGLILRRYLEEQGFALVKLDELEAGK